MTLADAKPCACPDERTAYVQVIGHGDVALWFRCLDCGACWHRWPEGHYYRAMAERVAAMRETA